MLCCHFKSSSFLNIIAESWFIKCKLPKPRLYAPIEWVAIDINKYITVKLMNTN